MIRWTRGLVALLVLMCSPRLVRAAAPPNDLYADAITVAVPSATAGTTVEATADGAAVCGGTAQTAPGVWYQVVGTGEVLRASTCNAASYDTKISVYTDSGITCVTGADDTTGCSGFTTRVHWQSGVGVNYYILVHGYTSSTGTFTLSVDGMPVPSDACADATEVGTTPYTASTYTPGATTAADDPLMTCSFGGPQQNSNTVWYRLTPAVDQLLTATTDGSGYDTVLGVYTGSCGSLVQVACDDDSGEGTRSRIAGLLLTGGTTYYIEVADWGTAGGGPLELSLTTTASPGVVVTPTSGLTTTEAGGTASFTVVLATEPTGTVVIDVASADPGEGTASPAQLTFTGSAGGTWATPQTVTVTGADDAIADGDQGYTVAVSVNAATADSVYAALDPADVTATNIDDDPASLAFVVQPSTTPAWHEMAPAVTVQVLDLEGRPVTGSGATVALALGANPSGGTLAGTLTAAAVGGVASFADLRVDRPGAGNTLVATSPGLATATSEPFEITALTSVPVLGAVGVAGLLVLLAAAGACALRRMT